MTPQQLQAIKDRWAKATLDEFHGYCFEVDGSVWSIASNWRGYGNRRLSPFIKDGYFFVRLTINKIRKSYAVHRLICTAFHGTKPTSVHEVRHLNGDRMDNRAENLCWGTRKENAHDRKLHGTEMAAENGRKSAHKLKGKRSLLCMRGHDKQGRKECLICRKMIKAGTPSPSPPPQPTSPRCWQKSSG